MYVLLYLFVSSIHQEKNSAVRLVDLPRNIDLIKTAIILKIRSHIAITFATLYCVN